MILKYILYYKKNTGILMIKIIITLLPDLEDGIVALFILLVLQNQVTYR